MQNVIQLCGATCDIVELLCIFIVYIFRSQRGFSHDVNPRPEEDLESSAGDDGKLILL